MKQKPINQKEEKMKNSVANLLLLALWLSSCNAVEEPGGESDSPEIRVGSVVCATETKAPVITGTRFTAAITAIETEGGNKPDWTAEPTDGSWWQNSVILNASPTSGTPVSLTTPKNYHATRTTWLAAWYPAVKSEKGVVLFAGANADGTADVMWGGTLRGSKLLPIAASFSFTHALTQLVFKAKAGGDYLSAGNNGVVLNRIEVLAARLPATLAIADGVLTYTSASAIPVPDKESGNKAVPPPLKLTAEALSFGDALMIAAMDKVEIKVTYTDSDGEKSATATIQDATRPADPLAIVAGSSHLVTLQLSKSGLQTTATVADWNTGNAGEIEF